jgi:N-sulfoglucosamine sulfohydrolase
MNKESNINRRHFLRTFVMGSSVLTGSTLFAPKPFSKKENRLNIVLIVSDDHGCDAVGCYGNPIVKTPNIDDLAKDGTRFTHAFCTSSSCSPSRSVILTGLHNHANGMYGLQHDFHHFQSFDNIKSLPIFLRKAGYRTGRIGKYHVSPDKVYKFETNLSGGSANDMTSIARSPVEMAELCVDFIQKKDERPFFLYFCLDDPHRGLPFNSWPDPNPFGNRKQGYPGVKQIKYNPKDVFVPSFLPDTQQCRAELAEYYQSVSRADQGIGHLVKILKELDKYDNTLIIYISDNGIAFPGAKTTLYEPGMRLPCIVRNPLQKKRGGTCNALISWTDITPTILDFADAMPSQTKFHGRSFKSIIEDKSPKGWDEIYASHTHHEITMYYPMRVVRERQYKLIWNIAHELEFPFAWDLIESSTWKSVLHMGKKDYAKRSIDTFLNRPEFELFDLKNDPDELDNLAYDPHYDKVLKRLQNKLKAFQKHTNDPWLYKWDYT